MEFQSRLNRLVKFFPIWSSGKLERVTFLFILVIILVKKTSCKKE